MPSPSPAPRQTLRSQVNAALRKKHHEHGPHIDRLTDAAMVPVNAALRSRRKTIHALRAEITRLRSALAQLA